MNRAQRVLLRNGNVVDIQSGTVMENAYVEIEGEKIIRIVADPELVSKTEQSIDLDGLWIMPGLIDSHVHLCMNANPEALNDFLHENRSTTFQTMLNNMEENLDHGVTTIRDMACPEELAIRLKNHVTIGEGYPNVVLCGEAITTPNGHGHYFGMQVQSINEMLKSVRHVACNFDFVKIMGSGGGLTKSTDPHQLQFTYDELKQMAQMAHSYGKPVSIHMHPQKGVEIAIAAGVDSIEHGSFASHTDVEAMAREGTSFLPTLVPAVFTFSALAGQDISDKNERYQARIAATESAVKLGAKLVAGTDAGIPHMPHGRVAEEVLIFDSLGMSSNAALKTATINAAELLRIHDQIGLVREGYRADLIVVRNNPFRDLSTILEPLLVMLGGKVVRNRLCVS